MAEDENRTTVLTEVGPPEPGEAPAEETPAERPEGEEQVSQALGGLRSLLNADYSDVETDPDRYRVRKLKGRDLKRLRGIVLDAVDKVREIREADNVVFAANEPARIAIRAAVEGNERRLEKGLDTQPLPEVTFQPEPESGLAIGRYLLSDVLDKLLFDDDSWLASILDEEEDPDDLELFWYLPVIEKVIERDDFPNSFARHLRIYQVFSNALKTKQQ